MPEHRRKNRDDHRGGRGDHQGLLPAKHHIQRRAIAALEGAEELPFVFVQTFQARKQVTGRDRGRLQRSSGRQRCNAGLHKRSRRRSGQPWAISQTRLPAAITAAKRMTAWRRIVPSVTGPGPRRRAMSHRRHRTGRACPWPRVPSGGAGLCGPRRGRAGIHPAGRL